MSRPQEAVTVPSAQHAASGSAPQRPGGHRRGSRIMGLETEYGVLAPQAPGLTPTQLSAAVVTSLGAVLEEFGSRGAGAPWDYLAEAPLADARGYTQERSEADPSQLTDSPAVLDAAQIALEGGDVWESWRANRPVAMNLVLGNGARFYVDHAHPEYSSPETSHSMDAALWDQAGDVLAARAAKAASEQLGTPVLLHKNNADGKGASYGAHENYLVSRSVPFAQLVSGLTPFFVSRPAVCGSGRVGIGPRGERAGFQISQRADYFEARVGLETTIRRPIINTRDEPHADERRYRRLHVIVGDANIGHVSTLVRAGSASLVLRLIEDGLAPRIELADPVGDMARLSHDPGLRTTVVADGGRRLSALDLQEAYLEAAETAYGDDPEDAEAPALLWWRRVVDALRSDPAGDEAARLVDWAAKYRLLRGYRDRGGLEWDDPRLALVDLQWADLRAGKGLGRALLERGRLHRLFQDRDVLDAAASPPADTRAYVRGRMVSDFPEAVVAANWDSLSLSLDCMPQVVRVGLPDPWRGGAGQTAELLQPGTRVQDIIQGLRSL